MTISTMLLNTQVRHAVHLEGLKAGHLKRYENFLKRIDKDIRKRLLTVDMTDISRTRLNKLLAEVHKALGVIYTDFEDALTGDLTNLAHYEAEFQQKALNNVAPVDVNFDIPSSSQLKSAVFSRPLAVRGADKGKLLTPFIKDWTKTERSRVIGAIRQGFFEGQTTADIVRAIRGTKANQYRDGILTVLNRNAEAIVRTSVQHVAAVARHETYAANPELIQRYRWVSTLDGRTSNVCRSLDSQVFEIGKGPIPPAHIRCRSADIPELSDEYNWLTEGRTRASQDGPVGDQSYYSWLKGQPKAFQDDVLGPTRGKLFRDGGLDADSFARLNLDKNFRPLTLAEMRQREPLAFQKAFDNAPYTKQAEHVKLKESAQRVPVEAWLGEHHYRQVAGAVENRRVKAKADELGLTMPERIGLRGYTGHHYDELNAELWQPGSIQAKSDIINQAADVLRSGLDKLPDHEGQVVRRTILPPDFLEQHTVGSIVEYKAFTSATFGKDVFSDRPHRLVIDSLSGKRIDWISQYRTQENEVLFSSPTKFIVKGRRIIEGGVIEIKLKEIPNEQ